MVRELSLITWNINGIRAIEKKGNLVELLEKEAPDLIFLQETKAHPNQLSEFLVKNKDYQTYYQSAEKKGYSGTALWLKKSKYLEEFKFTLGLGEKDRDREGRVLTLFLKVKNFKQPLSLISVYMPNGGKSNLAWREKLVFYKDFLNYINDLKKKYLVIWGGDVNCAHQAIDLARPKDNEGKIGFHPLERKALDEWVAQGWIDIWRNRYPDKEGVYSWWHLLTGARKRNVGWRIDYFFTHQDFLKNGLEIKEINYLNEVLGSDHCPLLLKIKI